MLLNLDKTVTLHIKNIVLFGPS